MKYKKIELIKNDDSETELLCNVEFDGSDEDSIDKMEDALENLFNDFESEIEIETVLDNLIQVKCYDISFDKNGIKLLKKIYDKLSQANLDAKITIGIHVDEWFNEDGKEFNEDDVTYEEFLKHLAY